MNETYTITIDGRIIRAAQSVAECAQIDAFQSPLDVGELEVGLRSAVTLAHDILDRTVCVPDFLLCSASLCTPFFEIIERWGDFVHPNRYIPWEVEPEHLKAMAESIRPLGEALAGCYMDCAGPALQFVNATSEADRLAGLGNFMKGLPEFAEALSDYVDAAEPFIRDFFHWIDEVDAACDCLASLRPAATTMVMDGKASSEIASAVRSILDRHGVTSDALEDKDGFLDALSRLASVAKELYPKISISAQDLEKTSLVVRSYAFQNTMDWEAMPLIRHIALRWVTDAFLEIRWELDPNHEGNGLARLPGLVAELVATLSVLAKVLKESEHC